MDDIHFFDLHVHVAPDLYCRRYTALSLGDEMKKTSSAAIMKSHTTITTGIASILQELGYPVYGSITLNKCVGGINTDVIKSAIAGNRLHEPMMIYFPTLTRKKNIGKMIQKKSHNVFEKFPVKEENVSHNGRLRQETIDVIKLASYYNIPMATGHSSKEDVFLLVEEVEKNNGRLILTHPFHPYINLSMNDVIKLMSYKNTYVEITILMLKLGYQNISDIIQLSKSVDSKRICISSDFGQVQNNTVTKGYEWFVKELRSINDSSIIIDDEFIEKLCRVNSMKFLNIK